MSRAPPRSSATGPMRALIASPTRRPTVIPAGEERVGERGHGGARAQVLAHVEAAPVRHRALRDHHEEAEDGEHEHAARGEGEARRVVALGGRAVADAPRREDQHGQQHRRGDRGEQVGVEAQRVAERDETRAAHPAERPAGVQGGHDRPPERLLDGDAVAVHRDVHRGAGAAEHEQAGGTSSGAGARIGRLTARTQTTPPRSTIRSEPWRTTAWPAIGARGSRRSPSRGSAGRRSSWRGRSAPAPTGSGRPRCRRPRR